MNPSIEHPEHLFQHVAQQLQRLYQSQLGYTPKQINCRLSEQSLAIVIDDILTKPEQLLLAHGRTKLVERLRHRIEEILRPQVKLLIEEAAQCSVRDVFTTTNLNQRQTHIIAVWSDTAAAPEYP
ncbi:MAG: hypothetical protein Kow00121_49860 [Elainellaceae cyanobacterium]